jgi:DedD protein
MAFFKFPFPGQTATASSSDAVNASAVESLEVLRKRARHRLMGSVVLVLVAVIGFPLLFDTQPRSVSLDTPIVILESAASPVPASPAAVALASSSTSATAKSSAQPMLPSGPLPSGSVLDPDEELVPAANKAAEKNQRPVQEPPAAPNAGGFKVEFGKAGATAPVVKEAKTEIKADAPAPSSPIDKARDEAAKARDLLDGKELAKNSDVRWIVQVGAFTDNAKVREARQKLEEAGFKTYTQVIDAKDGKRTRVRVGPFASKEEVDKVIPKIQKLQLETSILKL